MKHAIHPAVFLAGAIAFCALWLSLRPEAPPLIEVVTVPRGAARPTRASIDVDPGVLQRYVGHYEGRADFTVDLSIKDGRLYIESPVTATFEVLAVSETEFFFEGVPGYRCEIPPRPRWHCDGIRRDYTIRSHVFGS